jgi:hypothetical protein
MTEPTNPIVTRSRVVLEIASEFVAVPGEERRQAKVLLRQQGTSEWAIGLFGSSTNEGVDEVASGESALAMINPSGALTVAYRGKGPYQWPQPVRLIAVIPSLDQYVFAVDKRLGLTHFEDIGVQRVPLKVSVRGQRDHCLHMILDHVMEASGFLPVDFKDWGGVLLHEGMYPQPGDAKFQALARGEINAIFDEAADYWLDAALDAGLTILALKDETMRKLEAMGYRRAIINKARYPRLPNDILTVDFSGWPIFVREDLAEDIVTKICAGLDKRKDMIPWEKPGPLPVERMCLDREDTPFDVPFHPAAERYWRSRGYMT